MLVKENLIKRIKDYFDLNLYETKIWLALLGKGIASAGEIASLSKVPRSRTYDVLESLEKKGFAIVKIGKPVKYIGVKPRVILEKLKNNAREDAKERIENLAKIHSTDEFKQLQQLYDSGVSLVKRRDISASLKGKSNISNYLKDILQNAEKEVIICLNAAEFNKKMDLFKQTLSILEKRGVKTRIALSGDEESIREISQKIKTKIKKIDIDAKFFIIDKEEILFYISKREDNEDIAIWLNSDFFTSAFVSLFEKALGR